MERPKILIVDDDPRMLYVLEQALSTSEYDLDKVTSGVHALSKLRSEIFALVLLDVKMSIMDGLTTARMIRNETINRDIPIIFISGVSERDLISTCYSLGAVDFILKPIDYHILKSKVRFFADSYTRTEALRIAEEQLRRVRSQLERALAKRNDLLYSLENRVDLFYKLKDKLPAQVWMTDTNGLHNNDTTHVHPDDILQCIAKYSAAVKEFAPFKIEYRIRSKGDDYRSILDTGLPRYTPDGVFTGYIGSVVEITDVVERRKLSRVSVHEFHRS